RGHGVGSNWVYGRHAVAAALANPARRWRRLAVLAGQEDEAAALAARAAAERRGEAEAVQVIDRAVFDRLLPEGAVHQGWALEVEPLDSADLEDVLRAAEVIPGRSIVIVLDQVSDPHNVGAILRSAAAFGASAVIVGEHGAPPATGALAKAARSEEHTSELQSLAYLVCRLLLEKKKSPRRRTRGLRSPSGPRPRPRD